MKQHPGKPHHPPQRKDHYHLYSGEVIFRDPESDDAIASVRLNTMIVTPDGCIGARHIGKAQQAVQMLMFQKLGDPKLVVIDVFTLGISHLGAMTEEEFHRAPEGMKLQEVETPEGKPN